MRKTFRLGTSPTIGTLILPGKPLIEIGKRLDATIKLTIEPCDKIVAGVKNNTYDLGLIESPVFDDALVYKEWMEDELIVCSLKALPKNLNEDDLSHYNLLCRNRDSPTRMFISDFFDKVNLSYETFYSLSEIDNASAAIQGIKWSKPNKEHPTVAIVSQLAIEDELKKASLHQSRIKNSPMIRKFYLIYNKSDNEQSYIEDIIHYLQAWQD
jgi:DNA-binding transcriptional LysR family regulator